EDRKEVALALRRVVEPASHLDGDGAPPAHVVEDRLHDVERSRGGRQKEPASAAAEDFLHGATEVDVDQVVPVGDELRGGAPELIGLRAHELTADWMIVFSDLQHAVSEFSLQEDESVEDDLGHRQL